MKDYINNNFICKLIIHTQLIIQAFFSFLYAKIPQMKTKKKARIASSTLSNSNETEQIQAEKNNNNKIFKIPGIRRINSVQPNTLMKQLDIKYQISKQEAYEMSYLMFYILDYPSIEQAQNHKLANRLGTFDVNKQNHLNKNRQYCKCCGYVKQQETIPICTSFDSFPGVGISAYLFFQTIKNLILLLIFISVFHGIYSLISNLYSAGVFQNQGNQLQVTIDNIISWISLDAKVEASTNDSSGTYNKLYMIQMWIGVGLVFLWSLFLYLIRYFQRKYEAMVDKETISAADFSIIIQNYPKHLSKQQLQKQFDEYAERLEQKECRDPNFFHIQKINLSVDSNLQKNDEDQMQDINQKYFQMLDLFSDWICQFEENQGFPFTLAKRIKIYQSFHKIKDKRLVKGRTILRTMFRSLHNSNKDPSSLELQEQQNNKEKSKGKTIAIVTFKFSNTKDLIAKYNSMDFAKRIRHIIRCCPTKNTFILMDTTCQKPKPVEQIKIYKAPEPQDIKWENLSFSYTQKFFRKAATYIVTMILLSISFAIVYLLSVYQSNNKINFYVSFAISLTISIVNFFIGFLIRFLTIFEKDYTQTGYQTSLAVKSIWAQLLNSIVVPIIVHYIIQSKNIYGINGLSTDVIYLSITNSFLPPLSRLFDPYYRYVMIRAFYFRKSLKQRLLMKQIELNESQQLMEFETGYQYIYFINLYLFTAYFVTLQPCISIFAIFGMLIMYWVQKNSLLNKMRRPVPGTDLINTAMSQIINLGPVFFSVGALSWSHILQGSKVQETTISYYIPNIVAGGLAALFFIFPFNLIFDKYLPNIMLENLDYEQCRILLNSQYDRTNPATMERAIKQYQTYLQNYIQQSKNNELQQQKQRKQETQQNLSINRKMSEAESIASDQIFNKSSQDDKQNANKDKIAKTKGMNLGDNLNTITTKDFQINRSFLNRKKQVFRNQIRLRSKIGQGTIQNVIGQAIKKQYSSQKLQNNEQEGSNIKDEECQENKNQQISDHPFIKQCESQESQTCNNRQKVFENIDNIPKIQKPIQVKKIMIRPSKQNKVMDIINSSKTKQNSVLPFKLKKESQSKPKKIDLDFKALHPSSSNNNSIYENSAKQSRDQKYMNFFGKKCKMGSNSPEVQQERAQNERYFSNPYDRAFY